MENLLAGNLKNRDGYEATSPWISGGRNRMNSTCYSEAPHKKNAPHFTASRPLANPAISSDRYFHAQQNPCRRSAEDAFPDHSGAVRERNVVGQASGGGFE